MLSPIEPGTLLNQRYRAIRTLDRSEFYRTYLASDEGRFNELCVLEELSLNPQATEEVRAKSRERFQQEASKLYRLQHRQIAGVQATFEQGDRLFLVLSHIEGQTLQELLQVRQSHGAAFGEAEVRQLLERLLPVLDYLHRHQIVHGNIRPETIVLRSSAGAAFEEAEGEPVLTHFGAIADLANRLQSADGETLSTIATSAGYTAPEQRRTGQVNPSSDLYSLAATAVVLLAGKTPSELYDSMSQTWQWQQHANVSPEFAAVLNQMLQARAGDRYPSVLDVLQALEPPPAPVSPTVAPPAPPAPPSLAKADPSAMATVAVGGQPEPTGENREPQIAAAQSPERSRSPRETRSRDPFIPEPSGDAMLDNPWMLGLLTLLLAIAAGAGAWGLVTVLNRPRPTETPSPTPTASVAESPSPTPTETPSPTPTTSVTTRRIPLLAGESFADRGRLSGGAIANYVIPGQANQRLQAALESEGILLKILKPDGEAISPDASFVKRWEGILPAAGDYSVQLLSIPGSPESDYQYQLDLRLTNPAPAPSPSPETSPSPSPSASPSPSPSPAPSPTPQEPKIDREPVTIPPDQQGEPVELKGSTSPATIKRYLVEAEAGQVLQAAVLEGRVTLDIRFPDGRLVEDAEGVQLWEGQVLQGGQYQIDVRSDRDRNFTLSVAVRDAKP